MPLERPTVLFAGPSLLEHARPDTSLFTWRPPARRGDLTELDLPPHSRIVLIDGYMVRDHPPSPTEVFNLVEHGHEVWGCSSLGALRAAELRHHGMHGFGWVYDRVVDRTITYDDELVAPLDPRTGGAAGIFVANIRFGLEHLLATGRADQSQADHIIDGLRSMHFEQRTKAFCHDLAISTRLDPIAVDELLTSDAKRQDALELINQLTASVLT